MTSKGLENPEKSLHDSQVGYTVHFCLCSHFTQHPNSFWNRGRNNSINRCHSEQSFGNMEMFIHLFSGTLCRIVSVSHKNTGCIRWKSCTKVMYYTVFLVVYIYYKCTIWLQYKDSFKQIPLGTTIWLIQQQIKDITVKLFYQGQRLAMLAVNVLTWWVPSLIRNQSACIKMFFFKQHSLDKNLYCPPNKHIRTRWSMKTNVC